MSNWNYCRLSWSALGSESAGSNDSLTCSAESANFAFTQLHQYGSPLSSGDHRGRTSGSIEALEQAKGKVEDLLASASADSSTVDRTQFISQLQGIIYQLETVKSGTTVYVESQQLMQSAQKKLEQLQRR